jgi:hypothetical protein
VRLAGKFGQLLRKAGGAETGRITGAKEFKSRRAKRLGWRLREPLSLRMPIRVFPFFEVGLSEIRASGIYDLTICSSAIRCSTIYGSTIYGSTIYGSTIYAVAIYERV